MLHLHSEGIIHRDLACRNVLLSSGFQVKISDFGLSRTNDANQKKSNQTKSETGPLKWMSPESIKYREYSVYSDVWSFGVTLWEIITRKDPYEDLDAIQVALEVTNGDPPLRLVIPEYCPPVVKMVIQMCFSTQADKRPDFKSVSHLFANARLEEWQPDRVNRPSLPTMYGNLPDAPGGSSTSLNVSPSPQLPKLQPQANHYGNVPSTPDDMNRNSKIIEPVTIPVSNPATSNYGKYNPSTTVDPPPQSSISHSGPTHYGFVPAIPPDNRMLSAPPVIKIESADSPNNSQSVIPTAQRSNYGSIHPVKVDTVPQTAEITPPVVRTEYAQMPK